MYLGINATSSCWQFCTSEPDKRLNLPWEPSAGVPGYYKTYFFSSKKYHSSGLFLDTLVTNSSSPPHPPRPLHSPQSFQWQTGLPRIWPGCFGCKQYPPPNTKSTLWYYNLSTQQPQQASASGLRHTEYSLHTLCFSIPLEFSTRWGFSQVFIPLYS